MLKSIILNLFLILGLGLFAQDTTELRLSILDKYSLSVGNKQYEMRRYPEAVSTYTPLFEKGKLDDRHKYQYADMLMTMGEIEKAKLVLSNAQGKALNLLLDAYMCDSDYIKADSLLVLYPHLLDMSIAHGASLEEYIESHISRLHYDIHNADFNSDDMDFSPFVHNDILYFTSAKGSKSIIRGDNDITGGAYLSIYEVDENGDVSESKGDINTPYNDGPIAFNKAGDVVLVTRNNYRVSNYGNHKKQHNSLQIFKSVRDAKGDWGAFEMLSFCSDTFSCSEPFIHDNILYFTSDRPGSIGQSDIFKVKVSDDVVIEGEIENLGREINTPRRECFPFVDDNGVLYFSSNGFAGLGGLDIYKASIQDNAYKVTNMGHLINSCYDDFSFFKVDDNKGYLASNRPGGYGSDDIYSFESLSGYMVKVIDSETLLAISDVPFDVSSFAYSLDTSGVSGQDGFCDLYAPDSLEKALFKVVEIEGYTSFSGSVKEENGVFTIPLLPREIGVHGFVYNSITGERFENVKMRIYHNDTLFAEFQSDDLGDYLYDLELESDYRIVAIKSGFLPSEAEISTKGQREWIVQNLPLAKKIELEGILYEFDESYITPESAIILDNVVRLLNENPTIRIELGSHTDCRGTAEYNERLAKSRCVTAIRYLVNHGIEKSRLEGHGYGEAELKNHCSDGVECTPEEHHQNRRTEIKLIE